MSSHKISSPAFLLAVLCVSICALVYVIVGSGNPGQNGAGVISTLVSARSQLAQVADTSSGLIGWWKFDDGSGTTASDSAGGNSATLSGSSLPTWTAGVSSGVGPSALSFGGSGYVTKSATNLGFNQTTKISVSAWVKPTGSQTASIVQKSTNYSTNTFVLRLNANGSVTFGFDNPNYGGAPYWTTSAGAVSGGGWSLVTVSWDRSVGEATIYVNGAAVASTRTGYYDANVYLQDNSAFVTIGAQTVDGVTYSSFFSGAIDDVRIYNRGLAAADVSALYQASGGSQPPPSTFTLSVSNANPAGGTIASSPAGINCGATCSISSITSGTTYTLTASPGTRNATTWTSGCTSSNGNSCTVTVSANVTVSVNFTTSGGGGGPSVPPVSSPLLLHASANQRYLLNSNNQPFPIIGDSPWSMIAQLNDTDITTYLNNRQAKGFNAIIVNVLEHQFSANAPRNIAGDAPFTPFNAGVAFSGLGVGTVVPNPAYFAHIDTMLNAAATRGIVVFMDPLYLGFGCGSEGWCAEVQAASNADMTAWGQFLGSRYKNFSNIVWVIGGDTDPTGVSAKVTAFVNGIRTFDTSHLMTAHNARGSLATTPWSGASWLTLNADYSSVDAAIYQNAQTAYNNAPTLPFFLIEANFENEHSSTQQQLRAEFYDTLFSGGDGQLFGNCPIWHLGSSATWCGLTDWRAAMDTQGSLNMQYAARLISTRAWQLMVPDTSHAVMTAGFGTTGGTDYATVGRASDGSTIMAYLPTSRAVTVDMSKITGSGAQAQWYNPSTGVYTAIGNYAVSGTQTFTPPGAGDWILVIDSTGAVVSAPTISGVTASSITQTGATITWTTSAAASSQVKYGTTASYGLQTTADNTNVTSHSQNLTGLTANTTYHYTVLSGNANGNAASPGDFTFTTQGSVANGPCPAQSGKCWYVDNTATGLANGTSWANAWTTMKNVTGIGAGDIVYISGGPTGSSQSYFDLFNWHPIGGTVSAWVTYQIGQDSAHDGMVIFDDSRRDPNNADTFFGVTVGTNYFTISGAVTTNGVTDTAQHMRFVGYNSAVSNNIGHVGLKLEYIDFLEPIDLIEAINKVEISHCHFKPIPGMDHAIEANGIDGLTWSDNSIHDNLIELGATQDWQGEGDDGIQWGAGMDVYNNTFRSFYTPSAGGQHQDAIQSAGRYNRIYNNTFQNLANSSVYIDSFNGPEIRDILIYNNVFELTIPAMGTGYHRPIDVAYEVTASQPATIMDNLHIDNNTFVDYTDFNGISISARFGTPVVTNSDVKNNIFYDIGFPSQFSSIYSQFPQVVIDHNLVATGPSGVAGLPAGSTNTLTWPGTTSGFVSYSQYSPANDFHLKSTDTVAKDGGANLSSLFTIDHDGTPRPQGAAWDIGAYEYYSGQIVNPPPPPPPPPANALILHLDFANGFTSGTPSINDHFTDTSGSANNGLRYRVGTSTTDISLNKGWPAQTTGPLAGMNGAQFHIYLDGWSQYGDSGDYVAIPVAKNSVPTDLASLPTATVSAWAHYDANSRVDSTIIDAGYFNVMGSWRLSREYGNHTSLMVANGVSGNMVEALAFPDATTCGGGHVTDNCDTGGWHLYTFTFDGTTFTGYYDGATFAGNAKTVSQLGFTSSTATLVNAGSYFCVSCQNHEGTPQWGDDAYPNNGYMSGGIADVRIYNYALQASEVATLFGGGTVTPPAGDTTAPTVSITAPTGGATVTGATVPLSATASDNVGVVGVQFKVDGVNLGQELSITPYSGSWNTTPVTNGTHTITAVARDAAGNITTSNPITVTVNNPVLTADVTAPTVPTGLTASGVSSSQVNLTWNASTDPTIVNAITSGLAGYRVYRSGALIATVTGTSYSNTGLNASTLYSYTVASYDNASNASAQTTAVTATTQAPPVNPPPAISNGLPSSALAAGTVQATLSVTTNIAATCKYSSTANTAYASMTSTFSTTGNTSHSTNIAGLQNGNTYTYYVRCQSSLGIADTADYIISFSVSSPSVTPPTGGGNGGGYTSPGPTGGGGGNNAPSPAVGIFTPTVAQPTPSIPVPGAKCVSVPSAIPASALSLAIGSRGQTVSDLQTFLIINGYLAAGNVTGYFGPLTNAARAKYVVAHPTSNCSAPQSNGKSRLPSGFQFPMTLKTFTTSANVKNLQIFLNDRGYTVSSSGAGSYGNETTYYGPATMKALGKFQAANGISPAVGNFGPLTLAKVNQLLSSDK